MLDTGLGTGNAVLQELRWVGEPYNTNTSVNVEYRAEEKGSMSAFPIPLHSEQVEVPSKRKPGLQESSGAHIPHVATPHTLVQDAGQGTARGKVAVVRTPLSHKDTPTAASPAATGLLLPISRPLQSCFHPSVGYTMDWRSDEWVQPPQISNFT